MKKFVYSIFITLFLIGCSSQDYGEESIAQIVQVCNLNNTPTLFLYPALDLSSDTSRFFNNTEYEIIREGHYLGKFKGDRFNYSFLNLTYGDKLKIIISAQDKQCYVPNDYLEYFVACSQIQYITPELHCTSKFDVDIRDNMFQKLENNTIRISDNNNIIELELRFFDKPDSFDFFGCNYDKNYIEKTILRTSIRRLFETENEIKFAFQRIIYDLYVLEHDFNYELEVFLRDLKLHEPFNTSVYCTFFDMDWIVEDYTIKRNAVDKNLNDLGQPNPSFNFTIQYKP
mgnify:CR=1 FL=1